MNNRSIKLILTCLFTWGVCTSVNAQDTGLHIVAGAGFAINEVGTDDFPSNDLEEVSYKVGIGYELSSQWAFELAYQDFGDSELTMISDEESILDLSEQAFDVSGVQLSALGKAGNEHGELFYRLGVMQIMNETTYRVNDAQCALNDTLLSSISAEPLLNSCLRDNDELAGVVGIGFDFYVYQSMMVRLEMEYIQGEDDYTAQAAYLGFRFNF
jgi:opacity protein-like surface antigen